MKPCIGITSGTYRDRDWCPPIHGIRHTYVDAVVAAGGAPFLVPLMDDLEALRVLYERIDGLLLAGGNDMEPRHYGEEPLPQLGPTDPLRDLIELPLARWAMAEGKPVLGICRGLQVINVALGGTLYQDIPTQLGGLAHNGSTDRQDWAYIAHDLRLAPDSRLAELFETTVVPTNSLHHQALKQIAPGLRPVGWAHDGVVEAVEGSGESFLLAVQCHPEVLEGAADPRWRALFRRFVESCRR